MGGPRRLAPLLVALLLAPLAASLPGAPPEQGGCTPTAESRAGQLRTFAYTEDPGAGAWRTWHVAPGDVRVPPPPGALSAQAAQERAHLHALALARTPEQAEAARAWDEGPASMRWERLALDLVAQHGGSSPSLNPPRVSRMLALLETGLFDALALAWDTKYCYQRAPPSALDPALAPAVEVRPLPSYPSEHAVAAGAASTVLAAFFPQEAARLEALAQEAAQSRLWAGANWPSDVEAGLALGREVARRALAARADDGHDRAWEGAVPSGPCLWTPTVPAFAGPLEPAWGQVRPWAMPSGDAARPPSPPACDGDEWLRMASELHDKSLSLTPAERDVAHRWAGGPGTPTPPGIALGLALDASARHDLTTMRHARLAAHAGAALADAAVAAWDAKFAYWTERPVHTIRRHWDPAWEPEIPTPPFPGYVSGHATFSGAAAAVLAAWFPDEAEAAWADADEAAVSRFYGGIHVELDNEAGLDVGRRVASFALARAAQDGGA